MRLHHAKENSAANKRAASSTGIWALSFGCGVGWGAFVMPATLEEILPKR